MPRITFQHSGKSIEAEDGEWMYEVCERADAGIPFACKAGACGTCATPVLEGIEHLKKPSARELRTLAEHKLDPAIHRLPCLKHAQGDVTFGRPVNAPADQRALATRDVVVEAFRALTHDVAELRFRVDDPTFGFRAGQYMIFHVTCDGQEERRSYSISSAPADRGHFEVNVRAVPGGAVSNHLHRRRPGDTLRVEGPHGDLLAGGDATRALLLIANGTGIAPIKSILLDALATTPARRVRLLFGLRHETDLFHADLFAELAARHPQLQVWITLSRPTAAWTGERGRVTALVDRLITPADAAGTDVYLAGGGEMIADCAARLRALSFPEPALRHERFY